MTVDTFFADWPQARSIFDRIEKRVADLGDATVQVSTSQVAFRRRQTFAATWVPGRYLQGRHAALVLTIFLDHREPSKRWKEVVEPSPGHFTHHLELDTPADVDGEVDRLLRVAWSQAE